ncbi:MAG: NADH:ubiquinone reductase (Na(+)-transporting) subunit F [Thermoguttaceae bacterium]
MNEARLNDYSLVGTDTALAIEKGLAEAAWYASPVPRHKLRELLERRDGPAIRDTLLWLALIIACGVCGFMLWGTWWAVVPFAIYGVLYASTSDSRWHEAGHGTAFKTDWLNNALYEIASFMVLRESTRWRWSHARHHSDTIIVGRDPEIAVTRPPHFSSLLLRFFGINTTFAFFRLVLLHCTGRLTPEEKTFIPESEYGKVVVRARTYVLIYASVIGLAICAGSILPLMFVGLPAFYGSWLQFIYGHTQHTGLAENVLDHRLNSRTLHMNAVNRYLYWEMNYHVEHHMFPLVPYHNLARLHELVRADMPKPYSGLLEAWREIIPAVFRQWKDPGYYIQREPPTPSMRADVAGARRVFTAKGQPVNGWVEICAGSFLRKEDVLRFDHEGKTYAVYRGGDGNLYASDGVCSHGNAHLADGLVSGTLIECGKHHGRFDITDGSPRRQPACVAIRTYQAREHEGKIFLDLASAGGAGLAQRAATYRFRVVSNDNVATFIKELVLEPGPGSPLPAYRPGDYLQFDIPAYDEISFSEIAVSAPFVDIWKAQRVFDFHAENLLPVRRNFSMAGNPGMDEQLRFNVRISTPPRGRDCSAGVGSTYLHRLKPGDTITAIGPFGTFHIKPTEKEMVYLGGGAGMAPLRSHLAHLFETEKTRRRVSFWYGARSLRESFYRDYFENLAGRFPNFTFHLALSEPLPGDDWQSHTGLIHEVLRKNYLAGHPDPAGVEYYLCGPPAMVRAALQMLAGLGVDTRQIAFDEF